MKNYFPMKNYVFISVFCLLSASAVAQTPTATATATDTPTPTPTATATATPTGTATATATASATYAPAGSPTSNTYRWDTQNQSKALELQQVDADRVTVTNDGPAAKVSGPQDLDNNAFPTFRGISISDGGNIKGFAGSTFTIGGDFIGGGGANWWEFRDGQNVGIVESSNGKKASLDTSFLTDDISIIIPDKGSGEPQTMAMLSDIPVPTPYPTPTPDVSDTAYNATSWDGVTTIAPSKNAVRDKIELLVASITAVPSATPYPTPTPSTAGAKSALSVVGDGFALTTIGGTIYTCPSDPGLGLGSAIADEGEVSFPVPFACTLKNLSVRTDADSASAGSPTTVITVRNNGSDTALTVTMSRSNSTTTTDSTHTASFTAGQLLTISITTSGLAATSAGIATITMECDQN